MPLCTSYRLFFGGEYPINISSIRILESRLNLEKMIGAMTVLDNCISDNIHWANTIDQYESNKHSAKLKALFNYVLNNKLEKIYNQYIYNTFDCFRRNKKELIIDLWDLGVHCKDQELSSLILCQLNEKHKKQQIADDEISYCLHSRLFYIFPNVVKVVIERSHKYFNRLSLFGLISVIQNTNVREVRIGAHNGWMQDDQSWIDVLYGSSMKEEIVDRFAKSNFTLQFKKGLCKDKDGYPMESMMIWIVAKSD